MNGLGSYQINLKGTGTNMYFSRVSADGTRLELDECTSEGEPRAHAVARASRESRAWTQKSERQAPRRDLPLATRPALGPAPDQAVASASSAGLSPTNSMIDIGALSPRRGPNFTIRV